MKIAVIAYKRPEYLYVCLDSISRNTSYDKSMVTVYVDYSCEHSVPDMIDVCNNFGVDVSVSNENIGTLLNARRALNHSFKMSNKVILLEEDHIINTDTINECNAVEYTGNIVSLCGHKGHESSWYRPIGNLIFKELWNDIDSWIANMQYVGLDRPINPIRCLIPYDTIYDAVMCSYMAFNYVKSLFAGVYTCHFGHIGMNQGHPKEDDIELYNRMFNGDEDTWLDNITTMIRNEDYPEKYKKVFIPSGFDYR